MPISDPSSAYNPDEQLARLGRLCRLRSIAVYREQALYLQVLRDELGPAVRQALFSLMSETDPLRFNRLTEGQRTRFHAAIDNLINRCSVLLTVEQQMHLADQIQQEQLRHQARASRQMLQGLQQAAQQQQSEPSSQLSDLPPGASGGSVELSMAPPLDQPQRFGIQAPPESRSRPHASPAPVPQPESQPSHDAVDGAIQGDLDVLRSLFELAGEALEQPSSPGSSVGGSSGSNPIEGENNLLPTMPVALLQWMDSMDLALSRRLRNLSHAVNVQLLRSGLAQALLPVNLLETVLIGQMETQASPSNLLRLQLPLAMGDLGPGMDVLCVLVRSSELEFDSFRLRRCRRRLRDQHQELLKMVRQQRHWERRCLDREARTPWQTPPDPKSPAD
ncbi:conserved hypothetical protein [Synechococcus sp. WH 8103]|nr:hypothetical protein SynBOUM118_01170 [Synechococcus sp. BOUM118]QNJ13887.1 hypothetical protein SynA18461_01241 [Synechococcus sp. A18-46.1]RNC93309.1 MAG: hypothetical protein ED554_05925 [Synechococcus sp. YX04-3]CRY91965.1 conserved hypothetical protein [Synechococcus sp. WH 8103]